MRSMRAAAVALAATACLANAPSRAGEYLPERLELRPLRLAPIERNVNEVSNAAARQVALAHAGHAGENAEARVARAYVLQHLPVARLEQMQRERRARVEHDT